MRARTCAQKLVHRTHTHTHTHKSTHPHERTYTHNAHLHVYTLTGGLSPGGLPCACPPERLAPASVADWWGRQCPAVPSRAGHGSPSAQPTKAKQTVGGTCQSKGQGQELGRGSVAVKPPKACENAPHPAPPQFKNASKEWGARPMTNSSNRSSGLVWADVAFQSQRKGFVEKFAGKKVVAQKMGRRDAKHTRGEDKTQNKKHTNNSGCSPSLGGN